MLWKSDRRTRKRRLRHKTQTFLLWFSFFCNWPGFLRVTFLHDEPAMYSKSAGTRPFALTESFLIHIYNSKQHWICTFMSSTCSNNSRRWRQKLFLCRFSTAWCLKCEWLFWVNVSVDCCVSSTGILQMSLTIDTVCVDCCVIYAKAF